MFTGEALLTTSPSLFAYPKARKKAAGVGGGAPGKLQDRDTVGITWRGLVSRCVQQQMLALAPFFFLECED